MIRAVIFDLGHTLWDIGPDKNGLLDAAYRVFHRRIQETLDRTDLPPAEAVRKAVTAALAADASTYFTEGRELSQPPTHTWVAKGLGSLGLEVGDDTLRALTPALFATEAERLAVAEGTIEAVRELHDAGIALGCITNTLASVDAIANMLRRHDLLDVMGAVVVSSEEGWRKPHPRLFERALSDLAVECGESVFVGDSPYHDIAGAKACGMRAVQTTQYVARPPVEGTPPPDGTIGHLRELWPLIQAW
jgi:HAD superfamily hydrolase (TIGR01662 family)